MSGPDFRKATEHIILNLTDERCDWQEQADFAQKMIDCGEDVATWQKVKDWAEAALLRLDGDLAALERYQ